MLDKVPKGSTAIDGSRDAEPKTAVSVGKNTNGFRHCITWLRSEAPLVVGLLTLAIFTVFGQSWEADQSRLVLRSVLFVWLFSTILLCVFGVVRHADRLAEILGEPLGTLILTLSVIIIEVSLIIAVMLTGEEDPTLARDTMFAVLMIIMNGMIGLALLVGGIRHVHQEYNLEGARAYLAVLIPLSVVALILPDRTMSAPGGTMSPLQAAFFSVATIILYLIFLGIQTMRHRGFFIEPGSEELQPAQDDSEIEPRGRRSIVAHAALLFLTMVPIVGLSAHLADLVDSAIHVLHVPSALGGVVIAALILAPESISAFKAARDNKLQRSVNLCLGSALSTVALTVPCVLLIGLSQGFSVRLGLEGGDVVLLGVTLLVSTLTFGGTRTNVLQGAVHLLLFFTYIVLIFDP